MGIFPTDFQPVGNKKTPSTYPPQCLHIFQNFLYISSKQGVFIKPNKIGDATEK
jgi:hypothetical protein